MASMKKFGDSVDSAADKVGGKALSLADKVKAFWDSRPHWQLLVAGAVIGFVAGALLL